MVAAAAAARPLRRPTRPPAAVAAAAVARVPWHRLWLVEVEEALRRVAPEVAIPYCTSGGGGGGMDERVLEAGRGMRIVVALLLTHE